MVNLTPEQISQIAEAAEKSGKPISEFIKNIVSGSQDAAEAMTKSSGIIADAGKVIASSFLNAGLAARSFGNSDFANPFSNQIKNVTESISTGSEAFSKLANIATSALGMTSKQVSETRGDFSKLSNAMMKMAQGADYAASFRNGLIGMASSTGNLNQVLGVSGEKISSINDLMTSQQTAINRVSAATGLSSEKVSDFYIQLGRIPGALTETVQGSTQTAEKINMLNATMNVAMGTGKNYSQVISDLKTAYDNYGLTGENALRFTARISEISNNYNIQLNTMTNALTNVSDRLRGFADVGTSANKMAEGAASIFNQYIESLKNTGVTGEYAVGIIGNMTNQIGNLNIAQKAFLSGQTGGPGGLMGAFQIDKMLREGDIEGVFSKVRQQMQQQLGSIVSLQEATQSPEAAAQLTRQVALLRQGPLGSFARTDQDAYRVLEAFKGGEGEVKKLSETVVQDSMKKGVSIQEQSYTQFTRQTAIQESIRDQLNIMNLTDIQRRFTIGAGAGQLDPEKEKMREELRQFGIRGAKEGGLATERYGIGLRSMPIGSASEEFDKYMEEAKTYGKDMFSSISDFAGKLKSKIGEKGPEGKIIQDIENLKKEQLKTIDEKLKNEKDEEKRNELQVEKDMTMRAAEEAEKMARQSPSAAARTRAAAIASTQAGVSASERGAATRGGRPTPTQVDLSVTAICKHCQQRLEHKVHSHVGATNQATRTEQTSEE